MTNNKPKTKAIISQLSSQPESIEFSQVIEAIDSEWQYNPTKFTNGETTNDAGTNEGSCKIFSFAKAYALDEQETLALFGDFYRKDVLENPEGSDHMNIRNFMKTGWTGIKFENIALEPSA